ncbi:hypothetical protein KVR01_004792 [Diaporthe batatas]|uniref:uncharacterized protein n=1 Tax=Diaporthe batatas TaxID=748121 RepID=UPI001D03F5E6|nr:uncharacterized protein KVR01_004792 [Diaporthe batatas]KAG8166240.1 hypothetical protein KVR01_004792 [Diaporthe batatas]
MARVAWYLQAWLAAASIADAAVLLEPRQSSITITSTGNPILADGTIYSADPAPLVVNDTVYILAGRDEAGATENQFTMNQWQIFESKSATPSGGQWTLHQNVAVPQTVFKWASQGSAYASQIVRGVDGRYYLYAPVTQANSPNSDPFAIGVAVSNSPLGPFTDAHPSGPIISQSVPVQNNIQNIDPTVLVDNGKVYLYWGTFGQLKGVELGTDMVTVKSNTIVAVNSLNGFFEAPWLMKRKDTYYMLYAGNNAGPNSPCTPTSYHACIAYGTASNPLGPWTYRGIALDIVSSTTSHPGVFELPAGSGKYFLVYHTRDATGGTHFRRSIAFDQLNWDDTTSPPSIIKVTPTKRAAPPRTPTRNIAPAATPSSANGTPIQYWVKAINDERVEANPLPPDYWSSWAEQSPSSNTLYYTWNATVQLNGTAIAFFADAPAGATAGVAPPASWWVEYLNESGQWARVANSTAFSTMVTNSPAETKFTTISTKSIRAILNPSGRSGAYAAVGVKEWFAFKPTAS